MHSSQVDGENSDELEFAANIVRQAGNVALAYFQRGDAEVEFKSDGTPVTTADLAADALIQNALLTHFPHDAILSEETPDDSTRLTNPRCWIVDPIDGTRSFADGNHNWAVLLALTQNGRPVLGVAYWPAKNILYAGTSNSVVWREQDSTRIAWTPQPGARSPFRVAATLSGQKLLDKVLSANSEVEIIPVSTGLVGAPPLFEQGVHAFLANPPHGPSEWDVAALEPIILAAGGQVSDVWGNERIYNQPDPTITGGYVAAVDTHAHVELLRIIQLACQ